MTFRDLNARVLFPASQALMIFGIVALCQPWVEPLHRYGLTITLIGLVAFMVTGKIAPGKQLDPDDLNPFDAVVGGRHDDAVLAADDPKERP